LCRIAGATCKASVTCLPELAHERYEKIQIENGGVWPNSGQLVAGLCLTNEEEQRCCEHPIQSSLQVGKSNCE